MDTIKYFIERIGEEEIKRFFETAYKLVAEYKDLGEQYIIFAKELSTFFNVCDNFKFQTIFMIVYGSGLKVGKVANLRVEDIDSKKMRIFVREGKGKKERYTVLPKASLKMLRECYRRYIPNYPKDLCR